MTEPQDAMPDPYLDSGAYALDALTAEEVAAFEAAMEADPTLQTEAQSLQATAARLGAANAEPVPAGLRERVMADVDRTRQDAPSTAPVAEVVPMRSRSSARAVRILAAAAAVLAVFALGMSAWVIGLSRENSSLTAAGAAVTRVVTAPDARTVSGTLAGQAGRGAVVVSPSLGSAVFIADDVAGVPEGQTYQLWLIGADGSATSAGTFTPGPSGRAAITLTGPLKSTAAVGVTVEPAGGSTQPTSEPVLALPLA
jgi:anti-sigma-K factor RskA